ncbi:hypothetical protein ACH41H_07120 [Streptomyces sp. NPDC020800]|uniref:hypothetical protein n=1 Tax=Streptomyces sp. NPDC020800 TaxID=3365092 RepID=UPI0037ACBF30
MSKEYDQMLAKLHEWAPHAKILSVGYPTVIPKDTSKCRYNDRHQFLSITQGDLDWLRQDVLEPLNKAIEKSAGTQSSAAFVDLYDSSGTTASVTPASGSRASSTVTTGRPSYTPTPAATATPPTTSHRRS